MFAILAFTVTFFVWKNAKLKNALLSAELTELRVRISGILEGDPEKLGMSVNQLNKKLNVPLTHREFEVLKLALSEKSNGEIASETFVSVNTVKTHLKNIYEKLGVSNRKEALSFVVSDRG
ncbi:MAG: hypothetical protein KI790_19785 [Cyclobacteriaceae bacterium]|nr:hypothetical protein [Cyclobacteriaceae bacterium HetDA_MAG_MS6]